MSVNDLFTLPDEIALLMNMKNQNSTPYYIKQLIYPYIQDEKLSNILLKVTKALC